MTPDWDAIGGWFESINLLQIILGIAAVTAIVTAIVKAWPWLKKVVRLVDALADLPDFIVTTKDFIVTTKDFITRADQRIDEIHHEVRYNNGTSVKDAQKRTEAAVQRVEEGVAGLHEKFEAHLEDAAARDQRIKELEDTQPHPGSGVPKPKRNRKDPS